MLPIIELIQKEDITKYQFVNNEVLSNAEDIRLRNTNLSKAIIIGKSNKKITKLTFETQEGIKAVEVKILLADENYIILNGGIKIPLKCIKGIFI